MKIDELKKRAMQYSVKEYANFDDDDFIIIALNKFSKLVLVAEAAKKLVETTPADPTGYVQVPLSNCFFDLKEKLESLETK
jgi:hypothetical protein